MSDNVIPISNAEELPIHHKDLSELMESFLSGRSPKTIEAYRQDLETFRRFLEVAKVESAIQQLLTQGQGPANHLVLKYRTQLIEEGKSPNTVNRRLAALRSLVKLARTLGFVSWSIEIENVKVEAYRDTRGPGAAGVKRLLAAAQLSKNEAKAIRDTAIIRLLHDLALRRGEVVKLDIDDLDLDSDRLQILGKGRSQKEYLSIPSQTKAALVDWLAVRGEDAGPLFTNFDRSAKGNSQRLSGRSIHRIIKRLGEKIGVETRPHGLRHTAITEAIKKAQANGIDLEEVLDYSRHRDIKVLLVYRDRERNVQGNLAKIVADNL